MPDMSALAGNINLDESSMPDLSKLIKLDDLDLDLSHMIDPEEILKNLPADQVPDMSQALKSLVIRKALKINRKQIWIKCRQH